MSERPSWAIDIADRYSADDDGDGRPLEGGDLVGP
jgi:hypothetical protein